VDLTYIMQGAESTGDAGDQYTGLDRFDRVVDQRWIKTSDGSHTDRFQYGYDRNSNRTYRDNLVNADFGELYTYDGLNQIASFERGELNDNKNGMEPDTTSREQSWNYDALGNWDSLTTDGGDAKSRSHNKQNEITAIEDQTTPTYDANGNMTGDETGKQFVYDAWNRLKVVKAPASEGGATLETLDYDGLGRRVSAVADSVTTDLYYSAGWQVVEDRVGGTIAAQYIWSLAYVDGLVLRDRDTDANGSLDERLWPLQDANWNVTALLNGSGSVVELSAYDSFGGVTVYTPTYSTLTGSGYAWSILFQGLRQDSVTGSYYARMRDYSATLGRWPTTDSLMYHAGDNNFYRFVDNSPASLVDPVGLDGAFAGVFAPGGEQERTYRRRAGEREDPDQWAHDLVSTLPDSWVEALAGPSVRTEPPSFGVSMIPFYGSANQAEYHLSRGEYGWYALYTVLAASDVVMAGTIIKGIGRTGLKGVASPGWIENAVGRGGIDSVPYHTAWRTVDGQWVHAGGDCPHLDRSSRALV
jgi:RHS repeat-associated protein